jgi:hypothetical protein
MVSRVWPNVELSSITDSKTSMKSGMSFVSLLTFFLCSSIQLPAKVSNSLAIRFIAFNRPCTSIHPKSGIRSETTGTPDTYMNSFMILNIRFASPSSSPLMAFPKYLFPATILVIMFNVSRSIHSLITTLTVPSSPLLQRVYKSLIKVSTSETFTFFSISSRRVERSSRTASFRISRQSVPYGAKPNPA